MTASPHAVNESLRPVAALDKERRLVESWEAEQGRPGSRGRRRRLHESPLSRQWTPGWVIAAEQTDPRHMEWLRAAGAGITVQPVPAFTQGSAQPRPTRRRR